MNLSISSDYTHIEKSCFISFGDCMVKVKALGGYTQFKYANYVENGATYSKMRLGSYAG